RGNERDWLLAAPQVRFAHDGGFLHPRKLIENLFNLARVNVDPVYQQHIFFAVGDEIVALLVTITDISRQQPAVTHYFGRFFRLPPIALHDVAAPHANFTCFIGAKLAASFILNAHLHIGNGQPDRTGFARTIERVFGDDRTGFTQAVALNEGNAKTRLEFFQDLRGQGRRAADAQADGQRHICGGVRQAAIKLRNSRENGSLALNDLLQRVTDRVQRLDQDNRSADDQGQQNADREHVAMEHWQHDRKAIGRDRLQNDPAAFDIVQQIALR